MPRLGTLTIDVPCVKDHESHPIEQVELEDKAQEFLTKELEKIAYVRKVQNPHDFGNYPSFEIDPIGEYLYAVKVFDDEDECEDDYDKDLELKTEWWAIVNRVDRDYSEKFEEYL
jgi:hypothetical protein